MDHFQQILGRDALEETSVTSFTLGVGIGELIKQAGNFDPGDPWEP